MSAVEVLVDVSLRATLVLACAGGLAVALRKASAAHRHTIWLAAIVGVLALPLLAFALPSWRVLPRWSGTTAVEVASGVTVETKHDAESRAFVEPPRVIEAPLMAPLIESELSSSPAAGTPVTVTRSVNESRPWPWQRWVLLAWGAGCLAVIARTLLGGWSLRRLERSSRRLLRGPVAELAQAVCGELAQAVCGELGLRRRIVLLRSEDRDMPMAWGFFRSRLLLPADVEQWPASRLRPVLMHELAHVRRGDCATQLLAELCCALHWFNPLAWWARHRVREERELACDDEVLNAGAVPRDYARELLRIAGGQGAADLVERAAIAIARRSSLERRMRSILDPRRDRRGASRTSLVGTAVVLGLVLPALAMVHAQEVEVPDSAHEADTTGEAVVAGPEASDTILRGQLVDQFGAPVANAEVHLDQIEGRPFPGEEESADEWKDPGPVTTDAEGRFVFQLVLDRPRMFAARGEFEDRFEAHSSWQMLEPGEAVDLGTIPVRPAGSLRVQVVDPQGVLVTERGWQVEVQPLHLPTRSGAFARVSLSLGQEYDETAQKHFSCVPVGRVRVEASSERGSVAIAQEVEILEGVEQEVQLLYTGGDPRKRIVVNVRSEAYFSYVPEDLTVQAWLPGEKPRTAPWTENRRQYIISNLDPGAYTVEIEHPTFASWRQEGVQPGTIVEAGLRGSASILLEVTDGATGHPLDDYELLIGYLGLWIPDRLETLRGRDEPLPEFGLYTGFLPTVFRGSKHSHPILPEIFELGVRCPGYPDQRFPVEHLEPGEARRIQAVLLPGTRLEGQVFLADGRTAAAETEVTLTRGYNAGIVGGGSVGYGRGQEGYTRSVARQCKTDSDSRFHFDETDRGTWTVCASLGEWVSADETFELKGESERRLTLRLPESGTVSGRVLLPDGEGRYGVFLSAPRVEPDYPHSRSIDLLGSTDLDEEGRFHLGALPAGELELSVILRAPSQAGGYSNWEIGARESIQVRAGEETKCLIDASRSDLATVRLRLEVYGAPSSTMAFQLLSAEPRVQLRSVRTTRGEVRDGYRHLGVFESGKWQLVLVAGDRSWRWYRPEVLDLYRGEKARIEVELHHVDGELRFLEEGSGEVLANCEIPWEASLFPSGAGVSPPPLHTDDDGRVRLRLPAGELELHLGHAPVRLTWPPAEPEEIVVKLRR